MQIHQQATVGHLVRQRPGLSRIFERLGIDYCCGGGKSLDDACRERSLDAATVARLLDAEAETGNGSGRAVDADRMGLSELVDHIERTHHAWLRQELPRIAELIGKVHRAHGADRPQLGTLAEVFCGFAADLRQHMQKEEGVLFPWIRQLERSADAPGPCESIEHAIRMMEHEHAGAGEALETMRRLTDGFTPPAGVCNTYRAMLDALAELERDMHQHVHKENNVLFPRAAEAQHRPDATAGRHCGPAPSA